MTVAEGPYAAQVHRWVEDISRGDEMDRQTERLLKIILQEAHVIDFDFSKWDRYVGLVVVGGLIPENFEGQGPVHCINFLDVKEIYWQSRHLGIELGADNKHCQWVIMDFTIDKNAEGFLRFHLRSVAPPCPDIIISSRDVEVHTMSVADIDKVNPTWNRPYCPLARPSLQELASR